jgi:hypothetical protein
VHEDVEDELLHVGEDPPPLLDGGDDRREVVVDEDHRRRLARHVGAAPAHRDADVRAAERGRVVDPVSRHGDGLTLRSRA